MKREKRYLVFKLKDIKKYLNLSDQMVLAALTSRINDCRNTDKRPDLQCAVVESDWPEYESTWAAIAARVDAEAATEVDNKHYCNDGCWWQTIRCFDGSVLVEIGQNNQLLEIERFPDSNAAYKQKNKWLTKYNMFCPE